MSIVFADNYKHESAPPLYFHEGAERQPTAFIFFTLSLWSQRYKRALRTMMYGTSAHMHYHKNSPTVREKEFQAFGQTGGRCHKRLDQDVTGPISMGLRHTLHIN